MVRGARVSFYVRFRLISVFATGLFIMPGCATSHKGMIPHPIPNHRQGWLDRLGHEGRSSSSGTVAARTAMTRTAMRRREFVHQNRRFSHRKTAGHPAPAVAMLGDFQWPLRMVEITSPFGHRKRREFHEGVDLRAPSGTPVYASKAGIVLYADSHIKGYGNLVVVRHSGEIATIYAHNSKLLVRRGQQVTQGQQLALSGNTGHSTGPHVHFEIRRGLVPLNPLRILPRPVHLASSS